MRSARVERGEAGGERLAERREVVFEITKASATAAWRAASAKRSSSHAGDRVDDRHHPAEPQALIEHRIGAEREEDRGGIGEPAGFDDDPAKPAKVALLRRSMRPRRVSARSSRTAQHKQPPGSSKTSPSTKSTR